MHTRGTEIAALFSDIRSFTTMSAGSARGQGGAIRGRKEPVVLYTLDEG